LAAELGPLATSAGVADALSAADAVLFARYTNTLPADESAASVLAALLPAGAHFVQAFGTLGAEALGSAAGRLELTRGDLHQNGGLGGKLLNADEARAAL
jgi:predicted dinucleotide-binding enzyme